MTSVASLHDRLDLAGLDDLLSEEERAIRDAVRELCARRIDPHIATWWEQGTLPEPRELLAARYAARALPTPADQVIITAGAGAGLQVVAAPFDDRTAFRVAATLERVRPWPLVAPLDGDERSGT